MAFSALISILTVRQILFTRVEKRVEKSLLVEVREFRRLVREGRKLTNSKSIGDDAVALFDKFLAHNVPQDNEFFITLLNSQLYRASPEALPIPIKQNSEILKRWSQATQPQQGEIVTTARSILNFVEPIKISYRVEPINTPGNKSVFVVAHMTSSEYQEVDEAVAVVTQVTIVVLVVASILAWFTAGTVLAPLRLLQETARSISESDLTRRILVRGSDDIAELANTFNEMLDRLQAAFDSQRDFINDAGHELRTPITIIRGHLELLGDDPQERRETVALVTDELDRMSRLVDDLVLLAKAEQPDFLKLETVEMGCITEEIYTKVTALSSDRNWRLESRGSSAIVADRQRLTQALINLAQNATQHTKTGDTIALGSALIKGKARFWVRDTGEGISLNDQKRIFERFARGSNSYRRSEGAGLGLAIVRAIAVAHGGQVELFSRPGGGSTFSIVIPIKPLQSGVVS